MSIERTNNNKESTMPFHGTTDNDDGSVDEDDCSNDNDGGIGNGYNNDEDDSENDDDDDNNDDDDDSCDRMSGGDNLLIDCTSRTAVTDNVSGRKSVRYMEMEAIFNHLMVHLEDCDDTYFDQVKKRLEQQATKVYEYTISQKRLSNQNQSTRCLQIPVSQTQQENTRGRKRKIS
jgi:hypothetical protein